MKKMYKKMGERNKEKVNKKELNQILNRKCSDQITKFLIQVRYIYIYIYIYSFIFK